MSELLGYDTMNEAALYDDAYFQSRIDPRRAVAYRQDAESLRQFFPEMESVLDIGSGSGEFGEFLGCEYYPFDPFAGRRTLPNEPYDVVTFRGTLQHIHNPVEMLMLARARARMGIAILATPDTDSLGYMRWGTLPALDPPRNWIPFGRRMLVNILERLGFREIVVRHPYGKPYARPLVNLWNFVIGKPDAFPGNMLECFARL